MVFEQEIDFTKLTFEGPLGEFTGYYTPGSEKPIARIKAITRRNGACFQALLTGVPPTENHILKQLPYEASFFAAIKALHPTITNVAVPPSGGVAFYVVMAMKQRYAGEARHEKWLRGSATSLTLLVRATSLQQSRRTRFVMATDGLTPLGCRQIS
jgi:2,5-furandicarboxylate decarboxylase 1